RSEPFEMHGRLAGDREGFHHEPARDAGRGHQLDLGALRQGPPVHLAGEPLQRPVQHVVLDEAAADGLGRVHHEPLPFAQAEQPPPAAEPSTWILTDVLPGPGTAAPSTAVTWPAPRRCMTWLRHPS